MKRAAVRRKTKRAPARRATRNSAVAAMDGAVTPAALMAAAELAREAAYAPYSKFAVGAALLTADGRIFTGCNVENSSYGLSICAERNAVWKAVSDGARKFVAVAVTAGPKRFASPCGACRQVLHEFEPNLWVLWRDGRGQMKHNRLGDLLAKAFDFPGMKR